MQTSFLNDQFALHYRFMEDQLSTSPDGGQYLCGKDVTAADILMSFPVEVGNHRSGVKKEDYPKCFEYVEKLHEREAYKRAVDKIVEVEGEFKSSL
jgi:glutathione S-transferase